MNPVLRKVALNGALTAVMLAVLGMMFAQLAGMWITASIPLRAKEAPPDLSAMKIRLPLLMGGAGFVFVAVGELFVSLFKRKTTSPVTQGPPQPDAAERLLEELLTQAETKTSLPGGTVAGSAPGSENGPAPAAAGSTETAGAKTGRPVPEHAAAL